jgi:hypothetical protein
MTLPAQQCSWWVTWAVEQGVQIAKDATWTACSCCSGAGAGDNGVSLGVAVGDRVDVRPGCARGQGACRVRTTGRVWPGSAWGGVWGGTCTYIQTGARLHANRRSWRPRLALFPWCGWRAACSNLWFVRTCLCRSTR